MNKTKLIFIDTETNDVKNPVLIQLGYMLVEVDDKSPTGYNTLREVGTLVNCGAVPMNPYAFAVHGIPVLRCNQYGIPPQAVCATLSADLAIANCAVYHNASFDTRVLKLFGESVTLGGSNMLDNLNTTATHCTMKTTKAFVGAVNKNGAPKNPKLVELHQELFDCEPENQHDALSDVRATVKCYFALPEELRWYL